MQLGDNVWIWVKKGVITSWVEMGVGDFLDRNQKGKEWGENGTEEN